MTLSHEGVAPGRIFGFNLMVVIKLRIPEDKTVTTTPDTPATPSVQKPASPTLTSLSQSQIDAIRRIPPHSQADYSAIDARRSVSTFTDPDYFERERSGLFGTLPVPVTLSALVPEPGCVIANDSYGIPLVIARDRDGTVRAFLNACSHKGAKLVEDCEPRKAARLTCPYHAWSFAFDGKLLGVPRIETIAHFDKAERPLAQLACHESGGIIWVGLDRHRTYDFSHLDGNLATDLDALALSSGHVYGRRQFELHANWKLVLEPFLEGYHVQRLHAQSVGPLFADVPTITDQIGPHIRQTSGKANFDPALITPEENIHKSVTFAYQLFPNGVIVTSPYYISLMILAPRAANRTIVDYFMLTRQAPDNAKAEDLFARSYEIIQAVFGGEDFRAAEISQAGLESGALEDVIYCGLEDKIPLYYERLDAALQRAT